MLGICRNSGSPGLDGAPRARRDAAPGPPGPLLRAHCSPCHEGALSHRLKRRTALISRCFRSFLRHCAQHARARTQTQHTHTRTICHKRAWTRAQEMPSQTRTEKTVRASQLRASPLAPSHNAAKHHCATRTPCRPRPTRERATQPRVCLDHTSSFARRCSGLRESIRRSVSALGLSVRESPVTTITTLAIFASLSPHDAHPPA